VNSFVFQFGGHTVNVATVLQFRHPPCVLCIDRWEVGLSKPNGRRILFIGLTITTCFGRARPSSGHKLCYKLQGENVHLYMNGTYLEAVGIHRDQRDLVVNRFLYM
jgi:hypothetical protein